MWNYLDPTLLFRDDIPNCGRDNEDEANDEELGEKNEVELCKVLDLQVGRVGKDLRVDLPKTKNHLII